MWSEINRKDAKARSVKIYMIRLAASPCLSGWRIHPHGLFIKMTLYRSLMLT